MTPTLTQRKNAMQQAPPSLMNGFVDIDQKLVFNYVLNPLQSISGLQQPIARDGDFYLCAMQMTSIIFQKPTLIQVSGNVAVRISDDTGYRLMSDFVNVGFMSPAFGNSYPYTFEPSHLFKAGTRINIDLQELSGAGTMLNPFVNNIVQVIFLGRYRYRVADVEEQGKLIQAAKKFSQGR